MMPENANPNSDSASPAVTPVPRTARQLPLWLVAIAALGLATWQWYDGRSQGLALQQEVSRQLAEFDTGNKEERGAARQSREQIAALQAKLGALEGRFNEFTAQAEALKALNQEIARGREEATLLEIEQAITLAGQQLQLAGNVPVAVLALQTADARLARLDRPQYLPLRKAVAKDLERLNALPFVDLPGLSLRLEQLILAVDKLPLAAYGRPAETTQTAAAPPGENAWLHGARVVWQEIKGLVRIQRFDQGSAALLAPGQEYLLRENLKLRLLNARLALLARDPQTYRNELKVGLDGLSRYFDANDKAVQAAQASLKQLTAAELNVELPNLADTQTALRNLRQGKEKR